VAPPWGTALDEVEGLDLRRTEPPITEIIAPVGQAYPDRQILFAIQVYEKVNAGSLAELRTKLDWSMLNIYDFNVAGRNHGILGGHPDEFVEGGLTLWKGCRFKTFWRI
jgi:hypothetical protein